MLTLKPKWSSGRWQLGARKLWVWHLLWTRGRISAKARGDKIGWFGAASEGEQKIESGVKTNNTSYIT